MTRDAGLNRVASFARCDRIATDWTNSTTMINFERIWTRLPLLALLAVVLVTATAGCGGGGSSSSLPPPSPDDYFYNVLVNGKVIRWTRMPVGVYIDQTDLPPSWKPQYRTFVEDAMQEWSDASEGKLAFTTIASESYPCITVRWVTDSPLGNDPPTIGAAELVSTTIAGRQYIKEVRIELATTRYGRPLSDTIMKCISLHELGHAVGLWGHSDDDGDIMFEQVGNTTSVSARDQATLVKLYSVSPDVFEMPVSRALEAEEETSVIIMP